ncbi:helix-turn-helix domain-containing protein [Chitinophaga pendula]|uniref:helix-turn-helix domain-containing protein n=1 Tax=Chitinophaga TaxID=79328 RepID=UPI000BB00474|nr:hypothetical protein CK934_13060 [Chitinophaga sp. MD30]UCJ05157.1 helix-turn-helix domain-containing protein [Chitinophaga pendula]
MNNKFLKLVGSRLQYHRLEKGIKQEFIASHLHVSKSYVSKVENGRTPLQLVLFVRYCSILDISIHEILDDMLSHF